MSVIDAMYEAQKLAFGPVYFQVAVCLRELGILSCISQHRSGISAADIADSCAVSDYGVSVLLEAAQSAGIVECAEQKYTLTTLGILLKSDPLTNVNINFIQHVCYDSLKYLQASIVNGRAEGLKVFGDWQTIYPALSQLPEKARKHWFEFDHYYSDHAFQDALKIIFAREPRYIFDIGGNTGRWATECCRYNSDVQVKILDLPGQLNMARDQMTKAGYANRVDFHQIDLLDPFQKIPQGADAIWMSQLLDCFAREDIVRILQNVCQAAGKHTFIYILEPFIDNQRFEAARYSLTATSIYFTAIANGNSKMYSRQEMLAMAAEAGLDLVQQHELIGDSYHTVLELCRR